MNAHDLVDVGESALVIYTDSDLPLDNAEGLTDALTVNIHLAVDKVIIYRQDDEDEDEGTVYVADFVGFEEAEGEDGFRVRFANAERVGEAGTNWFAFSGRSDTATFHLQPSP